MNKFENYPLSYSQALEFVASQSDKVAIRKKSRVRKFKVQHKYVNPFRPKAPVASLLVVNWNAPDVLIKRKRA